MPTIIESRSPKVFIIVLSWNGVRDTLECLGSISKLDYPDRHTVVVDNGSSDGSPTQVKAAYPDITLIENGRNLGYTGGNNVGMHFALAQGADYVWLLNNDTVVEPDSLGRLVACAERTERLGMISPLVYDYYRRERLQFWGVLADIPRQNVVDAPDPLSGQPVAENPLLWGTALFVRSSMVRRIGYLDDRYFAYHEDLDFSLRAIKAGYRTMVETTAVVYHKWAVSLGTDSPIRRHLLTRNWYLFWRTHLAGVQGCTYAPKYLVWALRDAISLKDAGDQPAADACLDGAWSALRQKFGPLHETARMPRALKALFYSHPYFWLGVLRADIPFVLRGIAARLLGRAAR
jgi:GT2 family glycosyltransferase